MKKIILIFTLLLQFGNILSQYSQLARTHIGSKIDSDKSIYNKLSDSHIISDFPGFYDTKERVLVMIKKDRNDFYITKHNEQGEKIGKSEIIPLPKKVKSIKVIDAGNGKKMILYEEKIAKKQFKTWSRYYDFKSSSFISEAKLLYEEKRGLLEYRDFCIIDNNIIEIPSSIKFLYKPVRRYARDTIIFPISIYSPNGNKEKYFKIKNDKNIFLGDLRIGITQDSKFKVIASYSDNNEGIISGVVNFSIDINSDDNPQLHYNSINEDLILQYCISKNEYNKIKRSYVNGKNKTAYGYFIEKVITHKDGYFAIIQQQGIYDPTKGRTTYWFRDFIVASYDNNDNLNWISKSPGMFSQALYSTYSIECIVKDGELIIVYPSLAFIDVLNPSKNWDSAKRKGEIPLFGKFDRSKVYMAMHKFDINGKVEGDILYDLKKLDIPFFSSFSAKPINNSLVFCCHNAKYKYQILRFDFK